MLLMKTANNYLGVYVVTLLRQAIIPSMVISLPSCKPYFLWVEDNLRCSVSGGKYFLDLKMYYSNHSVRTLNSDKARFFLVERDNHHSFYSCWMASAQN